MKSDMTFIAEIGLNHNGNFGLFYELIKQASLSGANIAKFQLGWRAAPDEINNLTVTEITHILRCCDYHEITPMFSIFTVEAFELIQQFNIGCYKIASRTLKDDPALVERILDQGKRTFVSLGMWTEKQKPFEHYDNVEYLWCKSEYPAYPWHLKDFPKNFKLDGFHGYSDHTVGIEVALTSILRGATVVEKHFTLDKSDTTIRDHALSSTKEEFAMLVELGHNIRKNLLLGI